ncbi:MAG: hypothetical protein HQK50_17380, partial [Oligoflexia bacterium]|nr:hypothetical protein [Oligoflexia bacterium]
MKRKIFLAIAIIVTSLQLYGEDFIEGSTPSGLAYVFSMPDCLPNCTSADQEKINTNSRLEQIPIEAIQSARESVNFAQFTFSRQNIFHALVDAHARGVVVRGVVWENSFPNLRQFCGNGSGRCSFNFEPLNTTSYVQSGIEKRKQLLQNLQLYQNATMSERLALLFYRSPTGSEVRPVGGTNATQHNKFVLVDNSMVATGSGNWSSTAIGINLENLLLFYDSTTINAFHCIFEMMWSNRLNRTSVGRCQTDSILFTPASDTLAAILVAIK